MKISKRRGISLVALIVTIIVMIILTAAVVVTGINTPRNTEYAIKMHNQAMVQDAVTLYIMTEMLNGIDDYTASSPAGTKALDVEEIVAQLYNVTTNKWVVANTETGEKGAVAKLGINLTEAELQANFTLDSKGVVGWVAGKEPTRETDEDEENNQQQPTKTLSSIAVSGTYKTEYEVGDTFDNTGLVVTATYSDGSEEVVTSSVTYEPTLDTALATTNTSITVTYEDKTDIVNITVEEVTTLGELITDGSMYGTAVTGYTAGLTGYEVSDWSVFYEDTTNGYVYLIASNVLTEAQIPTITGATKGAYNGYGSLYWSSAPAVQEMSSNSIFKAQWSNYAANENGKCVSALLNTNNWAAFATPSDTTIQDYVVGAIGSPTAEMFAASWSAKNTTAPLSMTNKNSSGTESTTGYYYNYNGSINTSHSGLATTGNELYFPKYNGNTTYYWLASPSALHVNNLCIVYSVGYVDYCHSYSTDVGVRPVVCLESDIPATVTANGIDI